MGMCVSSQSKYKEVKQASGKREQATSPQRNVINTSKLTFKTKQDHLPKLPNLR